MKQEILTELKELDSSLANKRKVDVFDVKKDYFEEMQNSVLSKVDVSKTKGRVIQLFTVWRMLGIAAAVVVLFGAIFLMNKNTTFENEIVNEALYEYLLDNVDDIDNEMFATVINESDLMFEDEESLSIEEINEYFENNIDNLTEDDLEYFFLN